MRKLEFTAECEEMGRTHCYDSRLDRRGGEERTLLQPLRVYNLGGKSVRGSAAKSGASGLCGSSAMIFTARADGEYAPADFGAGSRHAGPGPRHHSRQRAGDRRSLVTVYRLTRTLPFARFSSSSSSRRISFSCLDGSFAGL